MSIASVNVSQRNRRSCRHADAHAQREALGISQGRLGRHLGLTFSQIQKYEKGTNRIGAGRLYQIATFLGVPPSHFFEGLYDDDAAAERRRRRTAGGATRSSR